MTEKAETSVRWEQFHEWRAEMRRLQGIEAKAMWSVEATSLPEPTVVYEGGSWVAGFRNDQDFVCKQLDPVTACEYALGVMRRRIADAAKVREDQALALRKGLEG